MKILSWTSFPLSHSPISQLIFTAELKMNSLKFLLFLLNPLNQAFYWHRFTKTAFVKVISLCYIQSAVFSSSHIVRLLWVLTTSIHTASDSMWNADFVHDQFFCVFSYLPFVNIFFARYTLLLSCAIKSWKLTSSKKKK